MNFKDESSYIEDNVFIHESSYIEDNVSIGKGTKIWHFCHLRKNAKIGKNVNLGKNVYIDRDVIIGDNTKIGNNVSIYKGVTIGDNVFIGPSVTFTNDLYPDVNVWSDDMIIETKVCDNVSIGANSTIICGVILNEDCLIGAGSVVTKDIKPNFLAYGNPAKQKLKNKLD